MNSQPFEYNTANLIASLSFYGRREQREGLTLVTSAVTHSAFNVAVIDSPVPDATELLFRVYLASQHFASLHRGWNFYVCEDLLDTRSARHLDSLLDPLGMVRILDAPGMETAELRPPEHPLPALDFQPVVNDQERLAFTGLISTTFHIPYPTAQALYVPERHWQSGLQAWVGYLNAEPVTCGGVAAHAGALGIYSVATLPQHRRRGCAEAIVRHAVGECRARGLTGPLVLQSTPDARRLYLAMGFKRTTRFAVYATI